MDANDVQKLEIRIRHLEGWRDTFDALNAERRIQSDAEFRRVHERLDKIDGHIGRLVWMVLGGIVSAFLAFVFSGALNVG